MQPFLGIRSSLSTTHTPLAPPILNTKHTKLHTTFWFLPRSFTGVVPGDTSSIKGPANHFNYPLSTNLVSLRCKACSVYRRHRYAHPT